jgi:SAM-dependent methyltransferase
MTHGSAVQRNATIWENLYAGGGNDLRYPSETLVRLLARQLRGQSALRVLDFGCGTGANLAHVASLGHEVAGVEVSSSAIDLARARLESQRLSCRIEWVAPGAALPYPDGVFDLLIAWQVLYYNDRGGWAAAVRELERVARPGALIVIATAAPGDVSQLESEPLGGGEYRSQVAGQEGCVLTIPDRHELGALFPGRELDVGEFGSILNGTRTRHWVVTYRMPAP